MKTKICLCCKLEKQLDMFYKDKTRKDGFYTYCKECEKQKLKKIYLENQTKKLNYQKNYYQEHKAEKKEYDKIYRENNKKRRNENENRLYATNDLYRIKKSLRNFILKSFARKNVKKPSNNQKIIGCSYEEFFAHLRQTFKNNYGYEWDGNEKVHIDHIIPLATAKTTDEVVKLCHYSNLQLLKQKDNLYKANKLNWTIGGN